MAEMQDYPLICLGKGTKSYEFFSNFYQRFGLKLNPDIEAGTIHQILPMVVYDLGNWIFTGKCRDRSPGRWENNKSTPYRENSTKTDLPGRVKKNTA